ncbi:STAS domain-containing protein [Streptomyces erythrochromogenes]|uniref:STAS domain-containing protein n=1 Tax=Streptomyces erythrochromogenes TaxID=285574 RepID=UPI00363E1EBB
MAAIMYEDLSDTLEAVALEVDVTPGPQPGTVTVRESGEIDFDNAATLRTALLAALDSDRGTLLVDMSRVTFCDCAGLHALLASRRAPSEPAAACASPLSAAPSSGSFSSPPPGTCSPDPVRPESRCSP